MFWGRGSAIFQSTHPLRGATEDSITMKLSEIFQSTHPLRGATAPGHDARIVQWISIHAPLAGCDKRRRQQHHDPRYFNPRTPCGVRRGISSQAARGTADFNPRTPCGVRRRALHRLVGDVRISIHAPLAGCDITWRGMCAWSRRFQSTHPLRGATRRRAQP